ncbi:MAG: cyclic nucleotide-binding domain-containing protein [Actinomycetota bacterium]
MDERLTGAPLFDGMSDAERETAAALFQPVRVLMGEQLTSEGDFGYSFFVVLAGRVKVDVGPDEPVELGPGDHFGEVSLVTGNRRNATVTALEGCELAKIMTWDFPELMNQHPALASRIQASADERG